MVLRRGTLALAATLALIAVAARSVAEGFHSHPHPGPGVHHSCAVCDAVHTAGTPPSPPNEAPRPEFVSLPQPEGEAADPVIFGLTASNTRGPPARSRPA